MSTKSPRDKGERIELEIVHTFQQHGVDAKRIPLSGATNFQRGDIIIHGPFGTRVAEILTAVEQNNIVSCSGYVVMSLETYIANMHHDLKPTVRTDACPSEFKWYNFDGLIIRVDRHKPIIVRKL